MQSFTVHWSPVSGDSARRYATHGLKMFALWPAPVNADVCFREAGFTDFGDSDENWDVQADGLLTRLLAELSNYGAPRLTSEPAVRPQPWYRRLFSKPEVFNLREQIELALHWDTVSDCNVAFGTTGVSLRAGSGHHIFWIMLPEREEASFSGIVGRVAGPHPIARTDLKWESLI